MLKIVLIQMCCEKADIHGNLNRMLPYLTEANRTGIDFLVFPEMNITGYADPTRYPEAIIQLDGPEVRQLIEMTQGIPSLVTAGLIEENPNGKPFITQILAHNGELLGCYRKITIENEEVAWFSAGGKIPVFQYNGLTFGISICADIGNEYVFAECARQGASVVFEVAAPGLYGDQATRNWQSGFDWWQGLCQEKLSYYARKYNLWIAVTTQAGRTIDEDFPGGGFVFSPTGKCMLATPDWSLGAVFFELDLEQETVIRL